MPLHSLLSAPLNGEHSREELLLILASVMEAFPVASFMIDKNHRVIHWNRACEVLTGFSANQIVGSKSQGKVFYASDRPVMADLILENAQSDAVDVLYHGKFKPSETIPGTYEAEDFFPHFGERGRWLYFTASQIVGSDGNVLGAIETLQDVTSWRKAEIALRESNERFMALSRIDDLTGLFNFRYFHEVLGEEITRALRYGHPLSLIVFDLDFFKHINDSYGHQEGDRVLKLLADQMQKWKRLSDFAFRFGGDEFAVVLPDTNALSAQAAAQRLADAWSELALSDIDITRGCTLSVGVAELAMNESLEVFLRRADDALYMAKRTGRSRIVLAGSEVNLQDMQSLNAPISQSSRSEPST